MKRLYLPFIMVLAFGLVPQAMQAQDSARIAFTGMNPHVGQHLYYRVVDKSDNKEIGRTSVLITSPDFMLGIGGIQPGSSYNLDFYADLNGNGVYDVPPADHAWRILLTGITADTTIEFVHNTDFIDIGLGTPTPIDNVEELGFSAYPNPAGDELNVHMIRAASELSIYNVTGAVLWVGIVLYAGFLFGELPLVKNNFTFGFTFVLPLGGYAIAVRQAETKQQSAT
jgi:hypothetical protein